MKKLNSYPAAKIDLLARPNEIKAISLDTLALEFFTDFKLTKPLVIESSISAVEVKNLMLKTHVRLLFVINEQHQFLGVISADDLAERKIVQKISDGFKREDIAVTDFMKRKQDLLALDYGELVSVSIGGVIKVLKDSGQQHCLVIDKHSNTIRGIFSASDISRKLHLPIDIQDKSSFYKVFSAIS